MNTATMPTLQTPAETRTITGQVVDAVSGEGLQLATIEVISEAGQYLGAGVSAGKDGYFNLFSPLIANNMIRVSYTGYKPVLINPRETTYYNTVSLERNDELEPVYVTPGNNKKSNTGLYVVGGLALLLLLTLQKKA